MANQVDILFKTGRFNLSKVGDDFINDGCFGEDFLVWLIGKVTAVGYTGIVHFTSTDTTAGLPANATLTAGQGIFSVALKSAGSQTLTVVDTASTSITGAGATTRGCGAMVGARAGNLVISSKLLRPAEIVGGEG